MENVFVRMNILLMMKRKNVTSKTITIVASWDHMKNVFFNVISNVEMESVSVNLILNMMRRENCVNRVNVSILS